LGLEQTFEVLARVDQALGISTANGSFATPYVIPSGADSTYGKWEMRLSATNAWCSSGAPSLARITRTRGTSVRATRSTVGRSVSQTGHVGERKNKRVRLSSLDAPPICKGRSWMSINASSGAGSPTLTFAWGNSAPTGEMRSCRRPIWRVRARTVSARPMTTSHRTTFETISASIMSCGPKDR
jgi:hypothetical protein